jgi:uncharacterized protein (TIGR03032 family)
MSVPSSPAAIPARDPARRPHGDQGESIDYQVTPSFVALLDELGCSLAISNYQSGAVMCFSSLGDGRPVQMYARFPAAMGLALDGERLAVATRTEVVVLTNSRKLAPSLPKYPNLFDGYFLPRVRYTVGEAELHDMVFDGPSIIAVNTRYSCICRIDGIHSFAPLWQPPFISQIRPGDRCHLNGMAREAGEIRYATALGTTDVPRGWTQDKLDGGVLMEVPSGRILAHGLCMPHSPRVIDGRLYLIEAGTGMLVEIDRSSGAKRAIVTLPGFARGLATHGGYVFVGLSLMRDSRPFEGLPVERSGQELICGVVAVEIATGAVIGTLRYTGGCTEIHDLQVVPGIRRLGISGYDTDTHTLAIDLPDIGFWLDPPPEPDAERDAPLASRANGSVPPR